jgi:hypothetical protein
MFVSEMEVRRSVSLIISKMETFYAAHDLVQYCSLIQTFRNATDLCVKMLWVLHVFR